MTILTCTEDELWALCVWREARGTSDEAKLGVASVIHNRATDAKHRWPGTEKGVILQKWQFSSFNPGDPNYSKYPVEEEPSWLACKAAVEKVKTGVKDPTGGANLYHSLPASLPWPKWATPAAQTCVIGPFHFYRS